MDASEPGLERYDWESVYAALEPLLEEYPEEALPELLALIERMLTETGRREAALGTGNGDGPAGARSIREIVDKVGGGQTLLRGDVAWAIDELRNRYRTILAWRPRQRSSSSVGG